MHDVWRWQRNVRLRRRESPLAVVTLSCDLAGLLRAAALAAHMPSALLSNGCSWHETHKLGGCQRLAKPRDECYTPPPGGTAVGKHRLAVLVPYRSREGAAVHAADLAPLCDRLGAVTSRSGIELELFVLNQVDRLPFNRGALANAAVDSLWKQLRVASVIKHLEDRFAERFKPRAFDYLAIHDVDRYPVGSHGRRRKDGGSCSRVAQDYYAFTPKAPRVLHPSSYAGGVLVTSFEVFRSVNGFSNSYWGWGEEDNDLFLRLRWCGLPPQHATRIDWCMEHRDCVACKKQKRLLDASVLHAHQRRMQRRLPHPRRHMLRDGLSTLNFSMPGRTQRLRCGPLRLTAMDVDLGGHRADPTDEEV